MRDDRVWLSSTEAAYRAACCVKTIYAWIARGLPAGRAGRKIVIKASDLDEWIMRGIAAKSARKDS